MSTCYHSHGSGYSSMCAYDHSHTSGYGSIDLVIITYMDLDLSPCPHIIGDVDMDKAPCPHICFFIFVIPY